MTAQSKGPHLIERQTVTAATARALREKILSGELQEGEQLRQDALAAEYGVSRIPLREALRQLEAEGLVNFNPHRGAVVSTLSLAEIEELFEIRAMIEPDVLRRAIPKLALSDLARAEQFNDTARALFSTKSDIQQWGQLNWQFHSTLYAPADRPRSMAVVEKLNINIDRYLRIQLLLTNGMSQADEEHTAILAACRDKRIEAAGNLLERHILEAGRSLVHCLQQQRAMGVARKQTS